MLVENPILQYPMDCPCFCGNTKKFKTCCMKKVAKKIPEEKAPKLEAYVAFVKSFIDGVEKKKS